MTISTLRRMVAPVFATFAALALAAPAQASGDLLVAPTRIVLDGPRGAEVVLNNIGTEPATYRVSLEIKRMREDGTLEDVAPDAVSDGERAVQDMLFYSPRRVTLPPNQPQTIRIGVRPPAGLADGEYRAHMLFRAVRDAVPVAPTSGAAPTGVSISLTPIYGVTIPIIVRQGVLQATAAIANPRLVSEGQDHSLRFDLTRQGNRSVYGEVVVGRPGAAEPIMVARGVAIYPERDRRTVALPLTAEQAGALRGPIIIRYIEDRDAGGATIAEVTGVLQ
ncbi:MAG: molecular chaperone [Sphingopyxis sp.]